MNPIFHDAAQAAQHGWLMGVMTFVFLAFFLGWAAWAWAPSNREHMDRAARMPLDDGGDA